jgi:hypothetical protein
VTCGPSLRSLSRSHDDNPLRSNLAWITRDMAPTSFILVLFIQERFLTYARLLIYLGSGIDPINGKLHTCSYLSYAKRLTHQSAAYHTCIIILDHVRREYTSRLNLHRVHAYHSSSRQTMSRLYIQFPFLLHCYPSNSA